MDLDWAEQQPTRAKSTRIIIAVFAVAMSGALGYLLWPIGRLDKIERELVGTWEVPRRKGPGGEIEAWVFKDDRTVQLGWMLNRKFVEEPVELKWSVASDSLKLQPQGVHIAFEIILKAERFVGYIAADLYSDPKTIVSLTEDELVLDRGGRKPEVLIKVKDQ